MFTTLKILSLISSVTMAGLLLSQPALANDVDDLTSMLHEFLAGVDTAAAHNEFWADDLVYTSSAGARTDKAEIMAGFDGTERSNEAASPTEYAAEDIDIRVYGTTAIVAFRLVANAPSNESAQYLNTGTFLKRRGKWQVIAWQATKIPAVN